YDVSEEAIKTSKQVIEKLGLSDKVKVINAAGQEGDTAAYDVVVIALLAQPKDKIAWNIKWKSSENTPVIVRYAEGDRRVFYRSMSLKIEDKITRYSF